MRRFRRPDRVEQRIGNELPPVSGTIDPPHARPTTERPAKRRTERANTDH